jgi:predicted  nucleic acid-binding Zn-ribbon protein
LTEGRLPVLEALRYGMILADALRKIHDEGQVHGAVSPAAIALTATGLELFPVPEAPATVTPYTAPELLQGGPPDARADIFAFGALLYEMLTGNGAFQGKTATELAIAIANSNPASSGSASVDRLVNGCLAKDPGARCQRMQKVILELKLLSVAARRAEQPAPARREADVLRAEMHQLESRLSARLESHEKAVADMQATAGEALQALRGELATVTSQLTEAQSQIARTDQGLEAFGERMIIRVQQTVESVDERMARVEQGIGSVDERIARTEQETTTAGTRIAHLEQGADTARQEVASLHQAMTEDFRAFEENLKTQAAALESARTAMAQTDDLVERVVEALEALQSTVLDQNEERLASVN